MSELSRKVGEMNYDGLFSDITPKMEVRSGIIRKGTAEAELKRGTVLAKSDVDNKLVILGTDAAEGETLMPYCILCDAVTVGTADDVVTAVYTAGCFNTNKIYVDDGYTMTDSDFDELRRFNIVFKAVQN